MGSRRKARELALQTLYLIDITSLPANKAFDGILRGQEMDGKTLAFSKSLVEGAKTNADLLDQTIMKYSENWEIKRMAALDRNLLRLGAYEIIFETDTPVSVIIDEAVEMAKTFSTQDSGKFVNGILDKIKNERNQKINTSS